MGVDFRSSDEDIIGFYLNRLFTVGSPLASMVSDSIHEIDVYGEAPPWEIAAQLPEVQRLDFYVFAKLKKRIANRKLRIVSNGKGTWKGQSIRKKIVVGSLVGQKKTFSFMADDYGKKKRVTLHWNMTKYSVENNLVILK
uniref:NAC domain-containing protein n=1 Tax=Kalanchoe fedtschenkoi TaxID=63787 RepID=A0A7N0TE08_KALFE